jgi:hypothetical protein
MLTKLQNVASHVSKRQSLTDGHMLSWKSLFSPVNFSFQLVNFSVIRGNMYFPYLWGIITSSNLFPKNEEIFL